MILQSLFAVYSLLLLVFHCVVNLNYVRIGKTVKINPKLLTILLPLLINVFIMQQQFACANMIFRQIPPFLSTLLPCFILVFLGKKLEKVRIFGLTGGIATGKSTLVKMINSNLKVVDIIDCDQIGRKLGQKGEEGYNMYIKLLGDEAPNFIDQQTKQIKRERLSAYAFEHPDFRNRLTRQIGKMIIFKVIKRIIWNIWKSKNIMLIDAPLLYETKVLSFICFPVIVVGCNEKTQISRLCSRNNYNEEEAKRRIDSQMKLSKKKKLCQIYLDNSSTEDHLLVCFLKQIRPYMEKEFGPKKNK